MLKTDIYGNVTKTGPSDDFTKSRFNKFLHR